MHFIPLLFGYVFLSFLFTLILMLSSPKSDDWIGLNKEQDNTIVDKFFNRLDYSLNTFTFLSQSIRPRSMPSRIISVIMRITSLSYIAVLFLTLVWRGTTVHVDNPSPPTTTTIPFSELNKPHIRYLFQQKAQNLQTGSQIDPSFKPIPSNPQELLQKMSHTV